MFLMHRVELKGKKSHYNKAPQKPFLMHRVELKGKKSHYNKAPQKPFLMHRVELKDFSSVAKKFIICKVPNAPCGVERTT